jgi:Gpi18-like mannosyltransferase
MGTAPLASTSAGSSWHTLSARARLACVLASGLAVRLALTPFGSFKGDEAILRQWADQLASRPLNQFYVAKVPPDHLPGDMWVLWLLAHGFQFVTGSLPAHAPSFDYLLKLVPCVADVAIGLALYGIARELADERAGLGAATCWTLNPGPIFLGAIWGQWDALATLAMLAALWAAIARRPGWALPALTYAALVKPLCGALLPFVLIVGWLPRGRERGTWRELAWGALAAYGLLVVLCLPLGVGVPPFASHSSLRARLAWARDSNGSRVTYNAFNLWFLLAARGHVHDGEHGWFGWTLGAWGLLLVGVSWLAILAVLARRRDTTTLIWASLTLQLALFVLPTRMHERYLFPAVALATLLAVIAPQVRWAAALLALNFAINLYWVYGRYYHAPQAAWMYSTHAVGYGVAALNLLLLAWLVMLGRPAANDEPARMPHGGVT